MTISNGSVADASEVKPQLYTYLRNLVNLDKHYMLGRYGYKDNFFADGFAKSVRIGSSTDWTEIGSSYSRPALYWTTTNSAELISKTMTFPSTVSYGTAYVDFIVCETVDEFNDSSFDTAIWDVVTDVGTASDTTEDTAEVTLLAEDVDGGSTSTATEYIRTDNTMIDSTHRYVAFKYRASYNNSGGSGTTTNQASILFRVDDGSNQVTLFSVTYNGIGTATSSYNNAMWNHYLGEATGFPVASRGLFGDPFNSQNHLMEYFYNTDLDVIDVYHDGMYYDTVDVSSVGNLRLGFQVTSDHVASSGTTTSSASLKIDWVRREKSSPASTLATSLSADNGSNYTSVTRETETTIANTGTQFKMKNTATISGSEYIHIRGYSAFLR